jgi:hypothetical protein
MTKRQPKGTPIGGQFAEDRRPSGSDLPAITRSTGTIVGGYNPGGGYQGATEDLDNIVTEIAEHMTTEFNMPVVIRFNSDRRRGGAWLNLSGNTSSVGINASLRPTQDEAKEGLYFKVLSDEDAQRFLKECDGEVHLDIYVNGDFLRNPDMAEPMLNGSRRLMQPIDNIGDAIAFIREHTIVGDDVEITRRAKVLEESMSKRNMLKQNTETRLRDAASVLVKKKIEKDTTSALASIQPAYRAQFESDQQALYDDYWDQITGGTE